MNGGISRGKGDYKVFKCDAETHLPKSGTYQAHIHTHTQMHGQRDIYKHCCELEEMRKRKVRSETQASRLSGLACCITDQRGAGERMTTSAICLDLMVLLFCFILCSLNLPLLQVSLYRHALFTDGFHRPI